jgi:hypothetical protein
MKKKVRVLSVILLISVCLLLFYVVLEKSDLGLLGNQDTESGEASATPSPSTSSQAEDSETDTGSSDTDSADTGASDNQNELMADHEDPDDYVWNSSEVIDVELNGNSINCSSTGVVTVASEVTITSAGNYRISGSLTDGQVIVDTNDKETVRLILNGVNISCSTSAPIYVEDAKKVIIVLQENTENYVTDGTSYVLEEGTDEPNAAIFSKADLTIFGTGSLTVDGNYNDGIASKDGLIIKNGTINVNAVDDGIRGKDYLIVKGGSITVNVGGDGLKSDNDENSAAGYIYVENGAINITSGKDAIQAATSIVITAGDFTLTSGGGSSSFISEDVSAKGLKANASITIDGGTFMISSADDAVHSNGNITVNGGVLTLSTGDDGVHADSSITVNGGDITITKSYEGLESATIIINGGDIHIASSDDGINVVGGNDASGINQGPGFGGGGRPGQDAFTYSSDYYLHIYGGYVYIDASGDGVDVNGVVEMTSGYLIVNGPVSNADGALDFGTFKITGGFLLAVGSSGMAQAPGATSTQESVLLSLGSSVQAGTLFNIQSSDGNELFSFASTKQYSSMAFSSPELTGGATYNVYVEGSSTGTATDGLYLDGIYTPGTSLGSFTA